MTIDYHKGMSDPSRQVALVEKDMPIKTVNSMKGGKIASKATK